MDLILKNAANVDVTYVETQRSGTQRVFVHAGDSLLEQSKVTLSIVSKDKTNRVLGKLSIPTVEIIPSTGIPGVVWTEVGSIDLSSVLAASTASANDFMAQFASLVASDVVKQMYVSGN